MQIEIIKQNGGTVVIGKLNYEQWSALRSAMCTDDGVNTNNEIAAKYGILFAQDEQL